MPPEENHGPIIQDEFHGKGGAYIVENGVRRLVEEPTVDHPEGNAPRNADGSLIVFAADPKKKAKAAAAVTPAAALVDKSKGGAK